MHIVLIQSGESPIVAGFPEGGAVDLIVGRHGARAQVVHIEADAVAALCEAWLSRIPCDPNECVRPIDG